MYKSKNFIGLTNYGTGHLTHLNHSLITKLTTFDIKNPQGEIISGYTDISMMDSSTIRVAENIETIDSLINEIKGIADEAPSPLKIVRTKK
jgi:hypothetical protein